MAKINLSEIEELQNFHPKEPDHNWNKKNVNRDLLRKLYNNKTAFKKSLELSRLSIK